MSIEKKKKRKADHLISDSSEHETESMHSYRDESPAPPSPIAKQSKKKKYKAGIPLFSMEDFSDLTNAVPKIEFPSGLKVRHPLFGIDFEERVGLEVPRKKKKSKKAFKELAAIKQEILSSSETEITPKKKKSRNELIDVETISRRIKMEAFSPNRSDSDERAKKKSRKSSVK